MMSEHITVDDLLLAHAAGRLSEPVGLVIATHLALSTESRCSYRQYEAIGGAMLEDLAPVELSNGSFARLLAQLDDHPDAIAVEAARTTASRGVAASSALPSPLAAYLPDGIDALPWKHFGSVSEAALPLDETTHRTRLIVLKAGRSVPKHTHDGQEITVVLKGAFNDGIGRYGPGDVSIADAHIDHQPVAEPGENCLCLTVTDAPLRLTGTFSRFLNPFMRF